MLLNLGLIYHIQWVGYHRVPMTGASLWAKGATVAVEKGS